MARIGSEEFYGAATDVNQPIIASQSSPSEEAYKYAMDNQNRYQRDSRETQMMASQSKQDREKSFGEAISSGLKALPDAFNNARDASNRNAVSKQQMTQNERNLERDEKYGDQKFQNEMEQQKQITESQRLSNDRSKAMQPFEVQRAQADLDNAPLIKQQLQLANKAAGLGNDSLELQNKATVIASVLANEGMKARSPQEKEQIIQNKLSELSGKYDEATLQKGRRLAMQEGFQDQALINYNLQSDPQFQKAQEVKNKLSASAAAFGEIMSEFAKIETDPNMVFDTVTLEQSMDNIASRLEAAGQTKLADNVRKSTTEAFLTPGSNTTKMARAREALNSLSASIKGEIKQAQILTRSNPHLSEAILQPYLEAVSYNPNLKSAPQANIFKSRMQQGGMTNVSGQPSYTPGNGQLGVGAGNFVVGPDVKFPAPQQGQQGQQMQQGQQQQMPQIDLMSMPGAKMKAPKPQQGVINGK